MLYLYVSFESFVREQGPRLRAGLVAAYGPEVGLEAAAEALAYGWEHWDRLSTMGNPSGYLYRVGQTEARRLHRPAPMLPSPAPAEIAEFDPDLLPALEALSESQRVCVVLIHAYGWGQTETAELLGISPSSVRTHLKRGLDRLHRSLEVNSNAD